ncbi:MAG: class I SAM-dependent methyltransferase [Myxococcota bacterium]
MWDERYSAEEYAYGTQPNDFLRANVAALPMGRVLSLAEGEGRNAVYLAQQGYTVTGVDASSVGLDKGRRLARSRGVEVELIQADINAFELGEGRWDAIVSIFFPLAHRQRSVLYDRVTRGLKSGGVFLMEAYTPRQLDHGTGGGKSVEFMQSCESLRSELAGLTFDHLEEVEREVLEGQYHTGLSSVLQVIARKP